MIISHYRDAALHEAFGIDMSSIDKVEVPAGWGRVAPGVTSSPHQHDEVETFVIISGTGDLFVDGKQVPARAGTVVQFEPFETHVITNTGTEDDIVFATFYWRDCGRANLAARQPQRRRLDQRPQFVFSTPPTPNGDLHLGHLSGPYLGADAYVRFQRMNGAQAWHLTGSDDYQSYVLGRAEREGRTPAQTAAHYSAEIAATLRLMDIEPDQYTVTSVDGTYAAGLQQYFSRLIDSGSVTAKSGPALFDGRTGAYLYEVDISGTCPTCGEPAGGNICEECGEPNTCVDLVDARSAGSDAPPVRRDLDRYTLPLHEFQAEVAAHHQLGRVPARLRELAHRVFRRPYFDLPVTHPASWGIAPAEHQTQDQVIWAWPEMSYGFLYHVQALGRRLGTGWQADRPDPDWKIVHFFGYDNSFYHAILYPVLYRLAYPTWNPDIDYHLNEFYLLEHSKFSTSRRHAVWGKDILGPQTVDAVRFYLCLTRPESSRTNFELAAYQETVQQVLIDQWQQWLTDLGSRLRDRYDGRAPDAGIWTPEHTGFLAQLGVRLAAVTASLGPDGFSLNRAAAELSGIVSYARRFSVVESGTSEVPAWSDQTRTAVALELAAALLLARCAAPVMPRFAAALAQALGTADLSSWPELVELVEPGTTIDLADRVFFRAMPQAPATAELHRA